MITYRSSHSDIIKEMHDINQELTKRAFGFDAKFKAWRKNNKSTENTILQESNYTINNNKVIAWWWGRKHGSVNLIDYTFLVETPNKNGGLRYIYCDSNEKVVEFTNHFCNRLQERLGMSIKELMRENIINYNACYIKDAPAGTMDAVLCINGIYVMGVNDSKNYCTVTTVINDKQEFKNQTEKKNEMNGVLKDYRENFISHLNMLFSKMKFADYNKTFLSN